MRTDSVNKALGFFLVIVIPILAYFYITNTDREFSFVPTFNGEEKPLVRIDNVPIRVSVADSRGERIQGLSGRERLEPTEGLLFIFDESDYHGIIMRDMLFPIDIIWIDENFRVVHIEGNVSPDTYPRVFEPSKPARFVIETNARYAESFGIAVGETVEIPSEIVPEDLRN